MKNKFLCLCLAVLALPALLQAAEPPLRVVTLHPILTEFASEIGGDAVVVEGLVAGGVDPHTFEPTPKQVAAARAADLVLACGLHLEDFLGRIADGAGPSVHVLRVGDHLPVILMLTDDPADSVLFGSGEQDPHWWHSLTNALFATDLIRAELTRLHPADAAAFARRAQGLQQRLFALQAWAAEEIRQLPPAKRHLFTNHDAFGYLARDYGFTVHPLGGLSTESEPDARHVAALIEEVRHLGVKAVFAEDATAARGIRTLAAETGAALPPPLFADGPGVPGSAGATYEAMYRYNLETIVNALR